MGSLPAERCQDPDCGALWPPGAMTAVEIKEGNQKRKIKVCPHCAERLVKRTEMVAGRCGLCKQFQPTGNSGEGDALGFCGFYGVPLAAEDEPCKEQYQPIK